MTNSLDNFCSEVLSGGTQGEVTGVMIQDPTNRTALSHDQYTFASGNKPGLR